MQWAAVPEVSAATVFGGRGKDRGEGAVARAANTSIVMLSFLIARYERKSPERDLILRRALVAGRVGCHSASAWRGASAWARGVRFCRRCGALLVGRAGGEGHPRCAMADNGLGIANMRCGPCGAGSSVWRLRSRPRLVFRCADDLNGVLGQLGHGQDLCTHPVARSSPGLSTR